MNYLIPANTRNFDFLINKIFSENDLLEAEN